MTRQCNPLYHTLTNSSFRTYRLPLSIIAFTTASCIAIAATAPAPAVKPEQAQAINVNILDVKPSIYAPTYTAYGRVIAENRLTLSAQVDGQLAYLNPNVVEGGKLGVNDPVYRQDDADLTARLSQRQAEWEIATAQLALELGQQRIAQKDYQMMQEDFEDSDWQLDLDLLLRQPQLSQAKAQLKIAHNALSIAQRDLTRSQWVSDKQYLVESKAVSQGDYLAKGDKLAILVDMSLLRIPIYLPRELAAKIKIGQAVSLFQPDTQLQVNGQISHVLPILNQASQLQKVYAEYRAPDAGLQRLIIGDFVKAKIEFSPYTNTLKLPLSAIDNGKVWLVSKDKTLQARKIELLHQDKNHAIINNVINESERIITSKLHRPQSGLMVNVVEAK